MNINLKATVSLVLCGAFLLLTSGCATIFKGEYRSMNLKSEPGGAQVFINGEYYGRTPVRVELRPKQDYTIEFKKDGYEPETRHIKNEIGVGWVILDVVLGVVPVLIDGLTGSWYDFNQKCVNAILERQQESPLN